MSLFKELGLSEEWVAALAEQSITQPTEIQQRSIPVLLRNDRDFVGLAQTGTGKTAAYGMPALQLCDDKAKRTQFLIVSPTRELAVQIGDELKRFSNKVKDLRVLTVYGGAPIAGQLRSLRANAPHILVATPGRLLDLIRRKAVNIDAVEAVVLDEADEMLNMGFKEDVHEILKHTGNHKIWMFSATMPPAIRNIAEQFMTNPEVVSVDAAQRTNVNIDHRYCIVTRKDRVEALKRFIDYTPDVYGLVFCRTRVDTQEVADELNRSGYRTEALHGDLSQPQRERVMTQFKRGILQLVIATDVAARGIDVNDLTHVFHMGMPQDNESFAHRSGRTARAGKSGISILLINPREESGMKRMAKTLKIDIKATEIPTLKHVKEQKLNSWANDILAVNSAKTDKQAVAEVCAILESLSKEELIEKLVAQQLGKVRSHEKDNLNAAAGGRPERGEGRADRKRGAERKPRRESERPESNDRKKRRESDKPQRSAKKSSKSGSVRYFINAGAVDGLDPGTLKDFVAEQSGVAKKDVDRITIKDRFAFFDVKNSGDRDIAADFDGLLVNGRKLRVNRDDE
jgi:ATP-dependent RNA helicase DeaD